MNGLLSKLKELSPIAYFLAWVLSVVIGLLANLNLGRVADQTKDRYTATQAAFDKHKVALEHSAYNNQLANIRTRLNELETMEIPPPEVKAPLADHEGRIRQLERTLWRLDKSEIEK